MRFLVALLKLIKMFDAKELFKHYQFSKSKNSDFDFALVLSVCDFQSRTSNSRLADKVNDWIEFADAKKVVIVRFLDFNKIPHSNTEVLRAELLLFFIMLKNFRNLGKFFRYYKSETVYKKPKISRIVESGWKLITDELNIGAVLGIGLSYELITACNDKKLPTAEIQHGLINSTTIESYWNRYDKNGKKLVPVFFVCWANSDALIVSGNGMIPIVVGYPKLIPVEAKRYQQKYDLGITLTHAHQGSADPFGCIPNELIKFVEWCANGNLQVAVRMHPVTWLNLKVRLNLSDWLSRKFLNIFICDNDDLSINQFLDSIKVHVTFNSSSAVESSMKNIPTYYMDFNSNLKNVGAIFLHESNFSTFLKNIEVSNFLFVVIDNMKISDALLKIKSHRGGNTFIN
jgi:hypothetical protein